MPKQMEDLDIILKYLVGNLPLDQKAELDQLLGKGNTVSANDPDDLAEDIRRGRIAMDRVPPRLMQRAFRRPAGKANVVSARDSFAERFPDAAHIRNL